MNKFKITWNDAGQIRAKIIKSDWHNVIFDAQSVGAYVNENDILKIELLPEATDDYTENYTDNPG